MATTAKKKTSKPIKPAFNVPRGVFMDHHRSTAIVVRQDNTGVWYLTMATGEITVRHLSFDRFLHQYRLYLPDYPLLRAVRKYKESTLARDDRAEQVMRALLRA